MDLGMLSKHWLKHVKMDLWQGLIFMGKASLHKGMALIFQPEIWQQKKKQNLTLNYINFRLGGYNEYVNLN